MRQKELGFLTSVQIENMVDCFDSEDDSSSWSLEQLTREKWALE